MVIVLMATVGCIGPIDCTAKPAEDCCTDYPTCTIHGFGSNEPGGCTPCGQLGQICCLGAKCENAAAICIEDSSSGFGYCQVCGDRGERCCTNSGAPACKPGLICGGNMCVMNFPDAAPMVDAPSDDGGLDALPD